MITNINTKKNKKTEKPWLKYIEDVESGRIPTGNLIKQAVKRWRKFEQRDDIYFDEAVIIECMEFIRTLHHFLGKSAGKPFILEPWQTFVLADILCWKWKSTGFRVCREVYIQVARKCGKTALIAALALYLMIAEGEASPEVICAANSTAQANIIFSYIKNFGQQLDPSGKTLKPYRASLKCLPNNGVVDVVSSDSSKMDGRNISTYIIDEFHAATSRAMVDVCRSSQSMRTQPLGIIITTAGFNLDGPCHDMYELAIQVLAGIKNMDNFQAFIYELDEEDTIEDENCWLKCQPNLDITATRSFMREELNKALNDSTAMSGVLTKTFNKWVQSRLGWIDQAIIARQMQELNLEDFRGRQCIIGCDLGAVSDFSAISAFFPPQFEGDKYTWFNWCFIPAETYKNHPWKELYTKFLDEGNGVFCITPGNVTDYDYVLSKIKEINNICPVSGVYLDKWNATQFQIALVEAGFNMVEYKQTLGSYNAPTKEAERLFKEDKCQIQKSSCVLWQFGNVELKVDSATGNCKPVKSGGTKQNKIDNVIAMLTALGGYLTNPISNDFEIFVL